MGEMLMLKQKLTLMLTTDMVDMEDMDTDASADLLLLKHLQLLIMAMEDTADMVDMDMDANVDLQKLLQKLLQLHITDMEATEDMDTDMDVKLLLEKSERKQPLPQTQNPI